MRRVAVVGSGIAGLATAYYLSPTCRVTLFEADQRFGGHAHTVDLTIDGVRHGVDVGFLVFNHRTYPGLTRLFAELDVAVASAEMSFSVQVRSQGLEWGGRNLDSVFADRRRLASPGFLRMLAEIVRFNRLATAMAERGDAADPSAQSLGEFLDRQRFSRLFRDAYLLPMVGCIWSCPKDQMLEFPLATLLRFCRNHGLLQLTGRPQWFTVRGGSKHYVGRMVESIVDARLATPVRRVHRVPPGAGTAGVWVDTDRGSERFDEVVLACHTDQSLAVLADASTVERAVLGAIGYQRSRAVLHGDSSVLPGRRHAWAAWNYDRADDDGRETQAVQLHYLINRLQPLPWQQPIIVTLNPEREPREAWGSWQVSHPVFDRAAIAAQRELPAIQGRGHVWFAGAWCGYGFHEDGLRSALAVVSAINERWAGQESARRAA
jgi:predicted NAD/FAD-binding protein